MVRPSSRVSDGEVRPLALPTSGLPNTLEVADRGRAHRYGITGVAVPESAKANQLNTCAKVSLGSRFRPVLVGLAENDPFDD